MGLQSGSKCIATIKNITLTGLMALLREQHVTNNEHPNVTVSPDTTYQVKIDFDVNWLFMSKTKNTDSLKAKVDKTVSIMVSFAKCGCICTPICDPDDRHHSKRASIRRKVDKVLLGIKVRSARYELIEVTQTLLSAPEDTDRNALETRKGVLSKLARRDINSNDVSHDLIKLLQRTISDARLCVQNEAGGYVGDVSTGLYQADLPLAKRFCTGKSTVICSSDSDFAMYIGSEMIQMKDFHFDVKTNSISKISLGLSDNELGIRMFERLKQLGVEDIVFKPAEFPFFSQYSSLQTRALIGFGLGCDIYKGGCKGVGPSNLNAWLDGRGTNFDSDLKIFFASKLKTSVEVIDIYVQAIINEPSNLIALEGTPPKEYEYLGDYPTSVHHYIKEFVHQNNKGCTISEEGPQMFECPGVESVISHKSLLFERECCSACGICICRHCCEEVKDKQLLCLGCFRDQKLQGIPDALTEDKEKMTKEINERAYGGGYTFLGDCSLAELQRIHKDIVLDGNVGKEVEKVEYPVRPPGYIFKNLGLKTIGIFNIYTEGGSFISKPEFRNEVPRILKLLSNCVTFDPTVKYTKFDSPVYGVIPVIVTEIANKSRRDSGYRLCCRCVRHATDTKFYPKQISDIRVIEITNNGKKEICYEWSCQIPASMKQTIYNTKVCITCDGKLYCCQCDCKAGGGKEAYDLMQDSERNMVCVHVCPAIMKLTMLLCDYLAEDICFEIAVMWRIAENVGVYSQQDLKSIHRSLVLLCSVALPLSGHDVSRELNMLDVGEICEKIFQRGDREV